MSADALIDRPVTVLWLRESFPWMGRHSGYDCLCQALTQSGGVRGSSVWRQAQTGGMTRWRRVLHRAARATHFYTGASLRAEAAVMARTLRSRPDVVHVQYAEDSLGFLRPWRRIRRIPLVATVHQPPSWWLSGGEPAWALGGLDAVIALSRELTQHLQEHLGERVHYVPHGVDTGFFSPAPDNPAQRRANARFAFVGVWQRDVVTLARVVSEVIRHQPAWRFDLVVPTDRRGHESLQALMSHPQVHWHEGLTDEELRDVYRQSTALLLPVVECTCNNAVLEALACGVPVISNAVGGMPDYVDEECGELVPRGDVAGLVSAVLRIGRSPDEQASRARAARMRATSHFDWTHVARTTMAVYRAALANAHQAAR